LIADRRALLAWYGRERRRQVVVESKRMVTARSCKARSLGVIVGQPGEQHHGSPPFISPQVGFGALRFGAQLVGLLTGTGSKLRASTAEVWLGGVTVGPRCIAAKTVRGVFVEHRSR
jgi:hypothetical protein